MQSRHLSVVIDAAPQVVYDVAGEMAEVLAEPALYAFTEGEPPTSDALARQYTVQARGCSAEGTERWINDLVVLGDTGRAAGYVQATVPVDGGPAEIAWVIGTPWQGRGLAVAGTALLLERLAGEGVRDVVAHIHPDHAASQAVARRLGMHPSDAMVDGEVRWEGRP